MTSICRRLAWGGMLTVVMLGGIFAIAQQNAECLPNPAAEREVAELRTAIALARGVCGSLKNPKSSSSCGYWCNRVTPSA